jgi:hypothetical protein
MAPSGRFLRGLALAIGLALLAVSQPARATWQASARAVVKVIALGEPGSEPGPAGVPLPLPAPIRASGVVVRRDCVVVTTAHGLEGAAAVAVRFSQPDRVFAAVVAHVSRRRDVAVLVVDRDACEPFVAPGEPAGIARGAGVMKVGFGGAEGRDGMRVKQATVVRGVVGRSLNVDGLATLEVYVTVAAGDSGGLVCDDAGRLVGLVRGRSRAGAGIGYVVTAPAVAEVLAEASSGGGLDRARRELKDPGFATSRAAAEVGAALLEADPVIAARLVWHPQTVATLRRGLDAPFVGRAEARLLLGALAASVGAVHAHDPAPTARAEGCALLERGQAVMAEAHRADRRLGQAMFEVNLGLLLMPGRALARTCVGVTTPILAPTPAAPATPAAPLRVATAVRAAPGPLAPVAGPATAPASAAAPRIAAAAPTVAVAPTAATAAVAAPAATATAWRTVLGETIDVYARWSLSFLKRGADLAVAPQGVQVGAGLPVAQRGELALGLAMGLSYTEATIGGLARVEVPFRISTEHLFLDVGPVVAFFGASGAAGGRSWGGNGGMLLRAGVQKFVQIGLDAVALGGASGPAVLGLEFFLGLGF